MNEDIDWESVGYRRVKHLIKHHMYKHPTYKVLDRIRQRCNNPNNTHYAEYGGRGTVNDDGYTHWIIVNKRSRSFEKLYSLLTMSKEGKKMGHCSP